MNLNPCLFLLVAVLAMVLLVAGCTNSDDASLDTVPSSLEGSSPANDSAARPQSDGGAAGCAALVPAERNSCCVDKLNDLDAYFDGQTGDCQLVVLADPAEKVPAPDIPVVEQFCGSSTEAPCVSDNDCIPMGCSSQVCGHRREYAEGMATTCEYRLCYDPEPYGLRCGCNNDVCQWG
ncbi:MAG: hypothetical protein GXP63_06305 [DPANN group archaeon]|nr:hypothetical protein [DPANN group archaeon]